MSSRTQLFISIKMFLHIKRVFRWIHEYLKENHQTIAVTGSLIVFSYITYHLPAHIRDSHLKTLDEVLLKIMNKLGKGSIEAFSALIGILFSFVTIFFYLPYTVYHDIQDLFGFRKRRDYLDAKFTKLLSECRDIQKIFDDERSLENLQQINEFFVECLDKFKADTDKIVTPTLEELFSDPNEFYHVMEEDLGSHM